MISAPLFLYGCSVYENGKRADGIDGPLSINDELLYYLSCMDRCLRRSHPPKI